MLLIPRKLIFYARSPTILFLDAEIRRAGEMTRRTWTPSESLPDVLRSITGQTFCASRTFLLRCSAVNTRYRSRLKWYRIAMHHIRNLGMGWLADAMASRHNRAKRAPAISQDSPRHPILRTRVAVYFCNRATKAYLGSEVTWLSK